MLIQPEKFKDKVLEASSITNMRNGRFFLIRK